MGREDPYTMEYTGQPSGNVRWMMLRGAGQSYEGLPALSLGCPRLRKLELIDCFFSRLAIAGAALQLRSLMHLWVDGYPPSTTRDHFLPMARPNWIIELIPENQQLLAYHSFSGLRTDFPEDQSVIPLVMPEVGGHMAAIPCTVCSRINFCTPDGVISPSTCRYFDKWLDFGRDYF
ncbi:Coronatine-insensitive protein [Ancistrocladus abbreviatus]